MAGVRIGTAEANSTFLSQGLALKTVLERAPALKPIDVSTSGHASVENANRLQSGDIDFGFMASNWIGRAKNGSALRTVRDLRGRRLVVGPEKSGMTQHARVILGTLGMTLADLTSLYLDFASGAEALVRGNADAQLQCPIPNKVMTALDARAEIRVLHYAADDLDTVLRAVPFYRRTVMRRGALRALDADVAQPAVVNVLVTHARVAEATVCEVTAAIFAACEELPRLNALFDDMATLFAPLRAEGARAFEFGGVALHPGAAAAYRAASLLG